MPIIYTVAELHFDLLEEIGRGGVGFVHRALDKQLNAIFAVKKIPVSSFLSISSFFEESRKLYDSRHHHVVPIQYACKCNDFVYIAMPYYGRGCIEKLMKRRFLTCAEVVRYSLQFLSGLNNIHAKGLVHFDIKPANFLISDADSALIADFGVAQFTGALGFAQLQDTTQLYAPPEYFSQSGGRHNLKFDIYQAGISMYRMCNGDEMYLEQARQASTRRGVKDNQHFIDKVSAGKFLQSPPYLPHIPRSLRKVIRKAIKPDPNDRYDSVLSMLNDLSLVTDTNKWQYSEVNVNDLVWVDGTRSVTAKRTGLGWSLHASKNSRKNNDYCGNGLDESAKDLLLFDCLNNKW